MVIRLVKLAILAVLGLVGLVIALAGIAYATDYTLEATVTDTSCFTNPRSITIETKVGGIDYTLEDVPHQQCLLVNEDNFVQYRVRSQRVSLWASEGGTCIYDSEHGIGGCAA